MVRIKIKTPKFNTSQLNRVKREISREIEKQIKKELQRLERQLRKI